MKNEAILGGVKIAVPPTLLLSAIGQIDDVRRALTLELREAGDELYALGETGEHTGASEYLRYLGERDGRHSAPENRRPTSGAVRRRSRPSAFSPCTEPSRPRSEPAKCAPPPRRPAAVWPSPWPARHWPAVSE